jgi:hypothetical protein
MITSFIVAVIASARIPDRLAPGDPNADALIMLVTVAVSTVVWVTVTFITAPESDSVLRDFYERVRPGGPGWARISETAGYGREPIPGGALAWTNWVAGVVAVYSFLFGIGKLVFGEWGAGLGLLTVAVIAFAWIARSFRGEKEKGQLPSGARAKA